MRYYDIPFGSPLHESHLMALILSCDFSELCTSFSKTFRLLNPLETLISVKNRNRKYWWMSKLLREAVEIYGDNYPEYYGGERGPFYCGLSCVMVMPSFSIRLNGPTSTTKQLSVAMNFAKANGIIIKLNNQYVCGGEYQRFFNVCWLSSYKEEDERLTIGGSFPIQIESIINTKTFQDFEKFFKPLFYFDSVLSGTQLNELPRLSPKQVNLISSLIDSVNGISNDTNYDQYIINTFNMFCLSKKTISVDLWDIDRCCPKEIKNILFESLSGIRDKDNIVYSDTKSNVNILRINLLNIFSNLQHIIIYSTDMYGKKTYQFSLYTLMKLLDNLKPVKCVVSGRWKDLKNKSDGKRSWIFYQYSSTSIISDLFSLSLTIYNQKSKWSPYNDILTIETLP